MPEGPIQTPDELRDLFAFLLSQNQRCPGELDRAAARTLSEWAPMDAQRSNGRMFSKFGGTKQSL
jgi:hypothetical protein